MLLIKKTPSKMYELYFPSVILLQRDKKKRTNLNKSYFSILCMYITLKKDPENFESYRRVKFIEQYLIQSIQI